MEAMGFAVKRIDKELGPAGDLSVPANRARILRDARMGKILGASLGPPCTSLSTMQDLTRVIRTRQFPKGVPNLDPYDQQRVDEGNLHALFCLKLMQILKRRGRPCVIENPRASRLWYFDETEALIRGGATLLTLDMCAYGAKWRKRTGLLTSGLDEFGRAALSRLCGGSSRCCGRTGRPHILLKGKDAVSGRNWTSLAQVYPRRYCSAIASALTAPAVSQELASQRHHLATRALPE